MSDGTGTTRRKVVVLTGGGSAGHVNPHLAIAPELRRRGWTIHYVGTSGIEHGLVNAAGIPFHTIIAGKLRRYLSFQNLLDFLRVPIGILQALLILIRLRPVVVYSKGGYVSVPVAIAGWLLRIPVITHESDVTPGLANRIIERFARRILFSFPETASFVPPGRSRLVGTPIRPELLVGDRVRGLAFCGFAATKAELPVLLVMGGSHGAQRVNDFLVEALPTLLESWRVVHLTGRGKTQSFTHENYRAFEFLGPELADVLATADLVVSRAGANAIFELLAIRKPMLLIPLQIGARGDQLINAESFVKSGWARVVRETELSGERLIREISLTAAESTQIRTAQEKFVGSGSVTVICEELEQVGRGR